MLFSNDKLCFLLTKLASETNTCLFKRFSLFYNTTARNERHEWGTNDTSATWVLHEWHECDMSATRTARVRHKWKILIFITTWLKTYFHTPITTIWQMKDYKERNNFILRTTFWKCIVPMPKCVGKVHHKNWTL